MVEGKISKVSMASISQRSFKHTSAPKRRTSRSGTVFQRLTGFKPGQPQKQKHPTWENLWPTNHLVSPLRTLIQQAQSDRKPAADPGMNKTVCMCVYVCARV